MTEPLPVADGASVRRRAIALARRYRNGLALVTSLHSLTALAGLSVPYLVGRLVDHATSDANVADIDRIGLLIAGCLAAQAVFAGAARYRAGVVGEKIFARLREDFVGDVLRIPLSKAERAGSGDLLTRMVRDIDTLAEGARFAIPQIIVALVTGALTLAALAVTTPWLALPCVAAAPVVIVSTRWYLHRAPTAYLREGAAYSAINASLSETVHGARTVEALRMQRQRIGQADRNIGASWRAERYTLFLRSVWAPSLQFGYSMAVAATLLFGGWMAFSHRATVGEVSAATLYVQQLVNPVSQLMNWLNELQMAKAALARLTGVRTGVAELPGGRVHVHGHTLALHGVRFAYDSKREILRGVTVTFQPGEHVAVVGPSGAGKTTLARLIARIYQPTGGHIALGGVDLNSFSSSELRGRIVMVTQEHHVFIGSIRHNVTLANPGVRESEVVRVLEEIGAWDWVRRLEHGLQTVVGIGGRALTPAQAQQIALARVMLTGADVLIFDEATSVIDPTTARSINDSVAATLRHRTLISVAHRLDVARMADRVLVMDGGGITEIGTHEELIAQAGTYSELWRSWLHGSAGSSRQAHPDRAENRPSET